MTEGDLLGKLLQFLIPLTLSSLLQIAFNAADLIVVGRFGRPTAMAAVGSNNSLIQLLVSAFLGLSTGSGILCARHFGAREKEKLREIVSVSILVGFFGGVLFGALGVFLSEPLLRLIGSPPDVAPLAAVYLKIYFAGLPALSLYNFAASQLRAMGDTRRPFLYLAEAGILNIGLNLFFVLVLGIDVAGVALATVISQCLSCLLTLRCLLRTENMRLSGLRFAGPAFREMLRIGLPAGIQNTMFTISNFLIQGNINSFGSAVVTGNAACQSVEGFLLCSQDACYQAVTTSVSQNAGAGKYRRAVDSSKLSFLLVVLISLAGSALFYFLRIPIFSLYTRDPAALEAAMVRLQLIALPFFLDGTMLVSAGMCRGMGHSLLPMVITFLGVCVFRVVWLYTVCAALPALWILYLSYPISWTVTTVAQLLSFRTICKRDVPPEKLRQA